MKKLLVLFTALFLTHFSYGQNIIDKHFETYSERENTTVISVSGKMFEYVVKIDVQSDDEDFNEMKDFISSLSSFDLIAAKDLSQPFEDYKKGVQLVSETHEELMRVRDEDHRFSIFIDEEHDVVYELVGIGVMDDKFIVISLLGQMNLDKLSKIASKIQSEGFEQLTKIQEYDVTAVKVYPNPISAKGKLNIEIPQELEGATATIFDVNGTKIQTQKVNKKSNYIYTNTLAPGNFVVEIKKNDIIITKRFMVIQ